MKMTKRIFIGILALAVLVSAFAVSAFAAVDAETYDDFLEYYTQPTLADWNFEDATVGAIEREVFASTYGTTFTGTAQYKTYINGDDTNKYFTVEKTSTKSANGFITVVTENPSSGIYIDFDVLGGTLDTNYPVVHVYVGDTVANGVFSGYPFLSMDFASGTVKYLDASLVTDANTAAANKTLEGFTVAHDKWYRVSLHLDPGGSFKLTITDKADPTKTATATDGKSTFSSYKVVNIGADLDDKRNKVSYSLDNVAITGGTYYRDLAAKQTVVETAVVDLLDYYNTLTDADAKLKVIDVYSKVVGYGFTSTKAEVNTALGALAKNAILVYSDATKVGVDAIDATKTYAERLAHITSYAKYADNIPTDLSVLSADEKAAVEAVVAGYKAEVDALAYNTDQSEKYAAAVATLDVESTDYEVIKAQYDALSVLVPDVTYVTEGGVAIADIISTGSAYVLSSGALLESSAAFVESVSNIATGADFNAKYANFKIAEANYFENETFPGVAAAVVEYNNLKAEFLAIEAASLGYIDNVNNADYAIYLSAKKEYLVVADAFLANEKFEETFPGVTEAKALYAELTASIAEKEAAAQAYIAAVAALEGLTGSALQEAINTAKSLQATGNIQGVEGIVEANVALDNAVSAIEIANGRAAQFVTYVNNIKVAATLEERFAAITVARAIVDTVTDGAGVAEAKTALAAAVTQYNADVKGLNDSFAAVNGVASGVLVAPTTAAGVSTKVVAFIKNLFA